MIKSSIENRVSAMSNIGLNTNNMSVRDLRLNSDLIDNLIKTEAENIKIAKARRKEYKKRQRHIRKEIISKQYVYKK